MLSLNKAGRDVLSSLNKVRRDVMLSLNKAGREDRLTVNSVCSLSWLQQTDSSLDFILPHCSSKSCDFM